ncbi:Zinc finger and SCAN domain-containing protein 5B [Chamberlinius hualienensis]
MSTTSTLLSTFKVKIDDAVALVPTMVAEEKLKAVQFWNVISERLQEIVNNSAADISALAFELEKQNAAKQSNTEAPAHSKPEESQELKMTVPEATPMPTVDQQVNSQLASYQMEMPDPSPTCKTNPNGLIPPTLPSAPALVPSYPQTKETALPVVPAGQILQSALNQEPTLHLPIHEQTLSGLISNDNETVFIEQEDDGKNDKKLSPRSKKLKPANSEGVNEDKWVPESTNSVVTGTRKPRTETSKTKSLPALRRQPPRNKRKKKNVSADSEGSDIESSFSSIKVTNRQENGCSVCGKQFAQTGILQTHMAMHMDQKEHLCEHCGKSFRQKSQLRLHMMRHEGVRKFQCNTCPSKFLTKGKYLSSG